MSGIVVDPVLDGEIGRLIEKEELSVGAVPCRYFLAYFQAATWLLTMLAVFFYSFRLACRMTGDFWLTKLIDASIEEKTKGNTTQSSDPDVRLLTYLSNQSISQSIDVYSLISLIRTLV